MNENVAMPGRTQGFFITFEGGEGSGKTTQIERLAEALRANGETVVVTREPGGSPGADAIRHIVLSGAAEALGNDMETVLFAAARIDHLQTVIRPALRGGAIVLCDRFHDSTRVYQGQGAASDSDFVEIVETATLDETYPDLTIILDIPAETGLERAAKRRGGETADRFEKEAIDIHAARRTAFLRIAEAEPDRCVVIDANRGVDEVAGDILEILRTRLKSRRSDVWEAQKA